MIMLAACAIVLITIDQRTEWLRPVHNLFSSFTTPAYWLAGAPTRLVRWVDDTFTSADTLRGKNDALREENLILQRKLQQQVSLTAENVRLRALLNSRDAIAETVMVANLLGIVPDPLRQEIILDRGSADGINQGQSVMDAYGLVGHVVEVAANSCRVLLIVDGKNAVPVQVNRTGLRAIAEGVGLQGEMRLRHVAPNADIKPDDILVTSGLGGRYPAGYPVAQVASVAPDVGQPFLLIRATPTARFNESREFLLVLMAGQGSKLP